MARPRPAAIPAADATTADMKDMPAMTDTLIIDGSPRPKAPEGSKKAARPDRKNTLGLKLLLSTAALAATFDGWALLAARDQSAATGAAVPVAETPANNLAAATDGAAAGSYLLTLPPIATVVPLPVIGSAGTLLVPGGGRLAAPANEPARQAAPTPPKATRPALRKVSPPPVAVTRSSR